MGFMANRTFKNIARYNNMLVCSFARASLFLLSRSFGHPALPQDDYIIRVITQFRNRECNELCVHSTATIYNEQKVLKGLRK